MINSFLNYTGSKYRIMDQLIPLFPNRCDTMIDIFGGSGVVTVNYHGANNFVFNDKNEPLVILIDYVANHSIEFIEKSINKIITEYGLTDTMTHGYEYYHVSSNKGLASINKPGYLRLRRDYNNLDDPKMKPLYLYALIIFGFNNQIRFNNKGLFNNPVGKRDFNKNMREKIRAFSKKWKAKSPRIVSKDFRNIEITKGDFVYADPPYLITTATYNENGGWTTKDDQDLLDYLDHVQKKGAKFALSNVIEHKGYRNDMLIDWSKKYNVFNIANTFKNSNYHTKNLTSKEVLITNYETSI
ncbi:Dam family site-specific DNA-(adenine-N6)-methyltransferase [Limosilactobacillus fermentum]|uniref:Dam family site-specific DNA-(adenine-N6)-methyltransferase n=1 Tax=Limosilactobacillus fermentum TaxID=1613 RepID=UPI003D7871C0